MRKLEQELGVKLFDRNQRSVELTVAGVALLEEARHVLRHAEVAQQAARNAGDLGNDAAANRLPARLAPRERSARAAPARGLRAARRRRPHDRAPLRFIDEVRERRLDAVITSPLAPTTGPA